MNKYAMSGRLVVLSTLVLSVACSKEQPLEPVCAMTSPVAASEPFEMGNPTLTIAAALGTALELGENFYPSAETYVDRYISNYGCYPSTEYYVGAVPPQLVRFEGCSGGIADALNPSRRTNGIMMEQYVGQLSYFNSSQAAFCPQSWEHFLQSPQSNVVRQFRYLGTGPGSSDSIPLNVSTGVEIGGWDPQVTLSPTLDRNYGIKISTTAQGAILKIHGANYRTHTWDHTVSSGDLRVDINPTDSSKLVLNSGDREIIAQENIRYYTAKARVTDLSWDYSSNGCGCLPNSGKIETVFSGSVAGRETITFSGCGLYEVERVDANGRSENTSHGKLNYCL